MNPQPTGSPIEVRIFVASHKELQDRCRGGEFKPTDVLVDADSWSSQPFHCVMSTLEGIPQGKLEKHEGGAVHEHHPETLVEVSYQKKETIIWRCSTHAFRVASITLVGPNPGGRVAPHPFSRLQADPTPRNEVQSGEMETNAINHQYKVHFGIQQERHGRVEERIVDPDVWCSF